MCNVYLLFMVVCPGSIVYWLLTTVYCLPSAISTTRSSDTAVYVAVQVYVARCRDEKALRTDQSGHFRGHLTDQ